MLGTAVQSGLASDQWRSESIEPKGIGEKSTPAAQHRIHGAADEAVPQDTVLPNLDPYLGSAGIVVEGIADGGNHQSITGGVQVGFVNAQVVNRLVGVHQAGHNGLFLPGRVDIHLGTAGA